MVPGPDAVARVASLSYRYGARWALEEIDLSVRSGEALAVLGPNGAGKSTLIATMLGLRTPTRGAVDIRGLAPTIAARRGLVAGMLQEAALPQFATVADVLGFVATLYPRPMPVSRAAELAGVGDLGRRSVSHLSGGQRRRVQFALALVANADFLFLDEPTEGMDIEARQTVWQTVRGEVRAGAGRTVLFTTHDLSEADRFADRVVLLARGRIIAVDTPSALKERLSGRRVRFQAPAGLTAEAISGRIALVVRRWQSGFEVTAEDSDKTLRALLAADLGLSRLQTVDGTLDEVFSALVAQERGEVRAVPAR